MGYDLIVTVDVVRDGRVVRSLTGCRLQYLLGRLWSHGIGLDDEVRVQGVTVSRGRVPSLAETRRALQARWRKT